MRPDLDAVVAAMALIVAAAALIAAALAFAVSRRPGLALSVFLDLLLAAGLLRLVGEPSWQAIATAAAIVALRRLLGTGLRIGGRSWTAPATAGDGRTVHRRSVSARRLLRPGWRT